MAIVNLTPDSFSDGGRLADTNAALTRCEQLVGEGAHILDIGGESTRPGAQPLPPGEELRRVLPVLREALAFNIPLSVDTRHAEVMTACLEIGVDIVNDVNALQAPGALEAVSAHSGCGVCLMHMQGDPQSMQARPVYGDVAAEVTQFLVSRAQRLLDSGVERERIMFDYGIGFGKTIEHNFELLRRQGVLLAAGFPLLAGWSRKSSLGILTGRPVGEREGASIAAALAAVQRGAHVVRVHDVAATVDALKVWQAAGLPDEP
ncbi:dihydropteroate synthase [soil metagenome]